MGWGSTCGPLSEGLSGDGSHLRLNPVVSSPPQMLEQGQNTGRQMCLLQLCLLRSERCPCRRDWALSLLTGQPGPAGVA